MSGQNAGLHWARILRKWPVDALRPEPQQQFQTLLKSKVNAAASAGISREINAAYLLLDNRLKVQYPLSSEIMNPESNPQHYTNLARELNEIPTRTWLSSVMKRIANTVRWR